MLATVVVCGCSTIGGNTTENRSAESAKRLDVTYEDLWRNEDEYINKPMSAIGYVLSDTPYVPNQDNALSTLGKSNSRGMRKIELLVGNHTGNDHIGYVIYKYNGTRYMPGDHIGVIGTYLGVRQWESDDLLGKKTIECPTIRAEIIVRFLDNGETETAYVD